MITGTELERLYVSIMGDKSHLDKVYQQAIGQTQAFADKMGQIGAAMTKYVTAPIVAAGGLSVHAFADFDSAMTESTALIKLTGGEIDALRQKALELGAQMPMGPVKAAEAYYELFSAGMSAKQALASLEPMMRFAAAGAFDLKTAVALAEGALSGLGLMSEDAATQMANTARVTDALVRASTLVSGSVEEFGRALTRDAAAALKVFNKDLEEGVAVLAAYHKMQIRGAMAGNTFGRMVRLLAGAAVKKADAFKQVGIAVFDAQNKMRNFADILADFERVMAGLSDKQRVELLEKLGIKALSQKALTPLIGMSEAIRKYEEELRAAGGVTKEVSDRQLASFSNQMKILKNQLLIVGIEIGEMIAPLIKQLGEGVKELIGWWKGLSPETKKTILILAGLAAAIGPVVLAIGLAIGAAGLAVSGIMAFADAVLAVGGAIAAVSLGPLLLGVAAAAAAVVIPLAAIALAAYGFVKSSGGWAGAWKRIKAAFAGFVEYVRPVWQATVDFFVAAWPLIEELAVVTWEAVKVAAGLAAEAVRMSLGVMLGDASMSWTEIRDTIVNALEVATFAVENFEVAARWAAVRIAQYFYDMANRVTFGMGGMVDDFTLGIGKALKEEEEAAKMAFQMWKLRRSRAAEVADGKGQDKPKGPLDTLLDQFKKWQDKMGDLGGKMGGQFAKGMREELQKVEPALWGSAEAMFRIADYRQMLRDGLPKDRKGVTAGAPGANFGAEGALLGNNGVIDLLKQIRDNTKDSGDGVEIDVADLE